MATTQAPAQRPAPTGTATAGADTGAPAQDVEAFAQRVLDAVLGCMDVLAVHLGDRLGWYRSLAQDGPATPEQLAARTRTSPRYAREWLEQQAVSGLLELEQGDGTRRYALGPGAREVLADPSSLVYLAPVARMLAASATQLPALLHAYRTGGGVSWAQLGDDARESQADLNRPWYETALAPALAGVPDLHDRLRRPGARLADVGCGAGWSSLALARAYPEAAVTGYDVDAPSLEAARWNAAAAGLAGRVGFCDPRDTALPEGAHDVVFLFECLHDLAHPVEVLADARRALAPGGCVVVMDEAVADELVAPGDDVERLMYGYSLLVCLPDGLSAEGSAGTGTVMRQSTLRAYAQEAGFGGVEVLPVEGFGSWRFSRLDP